MDARAAKATVAATVDELADELVAASHDIHAHPEVAWEEHYAADRLASLIEARGVAVERGAYGLPTAFVARAGRTGPNVVVCCEYDALPGIGHGCAHNVIGTAGAGAGLALAAIAEECGGRVTILGTPAEEGGAGKVRLLEAGAFADADVAMMVHPEPGDVEWVPYLAADTVEVVFHGRASHASSSAWAGVNALDALVSAYQGLRALRLREDERVHGIITDGGRVDNVVPDRAAGRFRVRAATQVGLEALKTRVLACFEGAALQVGATVEVGWQGGYEDLVANRTLAAAYRRNGEALGRRFVDPHHIPVSVAGSTDMGNVSKVVPSIHPVIAFCPLGVSGHTAEFAAHAVSEQADRAVADGAKLLAQTAIDVWTDANLLRAVRTEFEQTVGKQRNRSSE